MDRFPPHIMQWLISLMTLLFMVLSLPGVSLSSSTNEHRSCPCDQRAEAQHDEGADEESGEPCSPDEDCSQCACCAAQAVSLYRSFELFVLPALPTTQARISAPAGGPVTGIARDIFQPPRPRT